ncbi:glucose and ribitol dehydrogenase1 [Dorcoceras hygrometricum]|uniref:Glucose and ribitol dehydrogenase1 n=1 Tax=Dorcoceras hygrometricum TaxID=472368 RepID=A0A2Z7BP69_9LAMI|nr:glucose and ribitol dehydrogenase1 [Dorcoceras hygrometricum]
MASSTGIGQPPQKQDSQPGKQYLMDPIPKSIADDYKSSNKLVGKIALVTGGDSGIGRAVSHLFAVEGATIAFTYVKGEEEKDAEDTLNILKEAKHPEAKDPIAIPTDLGYDENCKKVVEEVVSKYGQIDILVNNAAEQHKASSVEEIDEDRIIRVFRTDIFSYFFVTRYVQNFGFWHSLKHMKKGSSIINTLSLTAYIGNPKLLDYTAAKGATIAFTRGLANQLLEKGIRVNGVSPGPVWTPVNAAALSEEENAELGKSEVPMKRAGQPYELAPSYLFLASNLDSSYYTGQVLHPNGGTSVNG